VRLKQALLVETWQGGQPHNLAAKLGSGRFEEALTALHQAGDLSEAAKALSTIFAQAAPATRTLSFVGVIDSSANTLRCPGLD